MTDTMPHAPAPAPDEVMDDSAFVLAHGGDWNDVASEVARLQEERIVISMGPQHPSTHGVLRLVLELDGEYVKETRVGLGFLHTGIEKTMEARSWNQAVTMVSRCDYVASMCNELTYCLAVDKLLGITDQIPERAQIIRVLIAELARVSSHLVALGSLGNELGGTTLMTVTFRGREYILNFFEAVTGQRMNNAFIRPGGVAHDIPDEAIDQLIADWDKIMLSIDDLDDLLTENPIFRGRCEGVGVLDLSACMALGLTGPILRSTGYPYDLRKVAPYSGYENYEFDVCTEDSCDVMGRYLVRLHEMRQSMRIVAQALAKLRATPGPIMVPDLRIAMPGQVTVGPDGQGQAPDHVKHILSDSMEGLIHHFKLVTEGFHVPPGQVFAQTEHPKGVQGVLAVSDGGTHPYRVHVRDAAFNNLQSLAAQTEGGTISDVIVCVASVDPVMGGVDR
ncbi:MAG: NADH-quinone oxidoreductase subunit D [Bifidobacteriaceae bacterium]|jgi:NADH-quinone oxidoreductase subunit D|nr:NADH-quinone oxidoreductase subunit D [Bifidobacteriaceae bacterium]